MKDIILALVARAMFVTHGFVGVWRAQRAYEEEALWLLLVPIGVLVVEALFTVGLRGGEEYKWVTPCVVLYLGGVIPSIWLLELNNFNERGTIHVCSDLFWGEDEAGCDVTYLGEDADYIEEFFVNGTDFEILCANQRIYQISLQNQSLFTTAATATTRATTQASTTNGDPGEGGFADDVSNTINQLAGFADGVLGQVELSEQSWVLAMHQLLLFIVIIGRWLLPTGEGISRDQLSQLLLVFIGIAADILEFVTETVKEVTVRCDRILLYVILGFWSWSMIQFTLVLTATKARKTRMVGLDDGEDDDEEGSGAQTPVNKDNKEDEKPKSKLRKFWGNMEVWGIMSTLILQDGPFLATRLYVMIGKNAIHQMIIFFTCKNLLIVILQLYRLIVIAVSIKSAEEEEEDPFLKNLETIKTLALAKNKFSQGLKKSNDSPQKSIFERQASKISPATNGTELPQP